MCNYLNVVLSQVYYAWVVEMGISCTLYYEKRTIIIRSKYRYNEDPRLVNEIS